MTLSKRLQAIADMVTPGLKLADIGTDHAYIPISLAEEGIIPAALAMDVREGPLERAAAHIRDHCLQDKVKTRLSDGAAGLKTGEADSVVISGMGGLLMMRILSEGAAVLSYADELILQPQSDISSVRRFLYESGYMIDLENMVCEDGKYYSMFRAVRRHGCCPEEYEYKYDIDFEFGKLLMDAHHPVLKAWLNADLLKTEMIMAQLRDKNTKTGNARLAQMQEHAARLREALERCSGSPGSES